MQRIFASRLHFGVRVCEHSTLARARPFGSMRD
jgi:hypothetical protein